MESMTITEALAEIKLITKKVAKKREVIQGHLTRYEHLADPYAASGGSAQMIKEEIQSVGDLEDKLVRIREAISKANLETQVTVEGETRSIYGWLAWRREVAEESKNSFTRWYSGAANALKAAGERPQVTKEEATGITFLVKLVGNVDLKDLAQKAERVTTMVQRLDGLLSLKNATITISF